MSRSDNPEEQSALSPEALKRIAEDVAGIKMGEEELKLCANRLGGLLSSLHELEKLDLGELEPLYTILIREED